ncbi:MAG: trypsin-like peptidase domain-containing protein [Gammaproteobacteria bacterium]|nr:MAG: trypsin-like peptidase domain-containing protein [Gammaproteobacteria bacterium]
MTIIGVTRRLSAPTFLASFGVVMILLLYPGDGRGDEESEAALRRMQDLSLAVEALARKVNPAVVEIMVSGYDVSVDRKVASGRISKKVAGGSGVLLDAEGYIVTNAHVIEGAEDILVRLTPADTRAPGQGSILGSSGDILPATLLGQDAETDLAVLKIDASGLPYLELADIAELRQGRLVFAFGSPLGLENSVSMGVVSSVARQLAPEAPMIYIQTDAAINPGNSGGPLVDIHGRVVGINTMIFSQSGGNEGIGFAAPSHIVGTVYSNIRESGRVRRGFIGTSAQTITPLLALGLGLPVDEGVILSDVSPGSPAAEAGLLVGDIVTRLDGRLMENGRQLDVNLYFKEIGGTVQVGYLRGGEAHQTSVKVIERPEAASPIDELPNLQTNLISGLGIVAVTLTADLARRLKGLRGESGVVVVALAGSLGNASTPLRSGDVIYAVNGTRVSSIESLRAFVEGTTVGQPLVLQAERQGRLFFMVTLKG